MQVFECCLALIRDWTRVNKSKQNPDKMEILLLGRSSDQLEGNLPGLNKVTFSLKVWICSLGYC